MPFEVILSAAAVVGALGLGLWVMRGVNVDIPTRQRKLVRANLGPSVSTAPDMREVARWNGRTMSSSVADMSVADIAIP